MGIFKSTVSLEDYMIGDCEECSMAICTCSYCLNLWYYNYLCESPLPPSSLGNKIFILDVFIYGFQCISNMFRKQSEVLSFKSISRVFLFTPGLADKELASSLSIPHNFNTQRLSLITLQRQPQDLPHRHKPGQELTMLMTVLSWNDSIFPGILVPSWALAPRCCLGGLPAS